MNDGGIYKGPDGTLLHGSGRLVYRPKVNAAPSGHAAGEKKDDKSASEDTLEAWRNVGELLETCKILREAAAACFRVINEQGPRAVDQLEAELKRCGIKDGFGLRAQQVIAKAESELGL